MICIINKSFVPLWKFLLKKDYFYLFYLKLGNTIIIINIINNNKININEIQNFININLNGDLIDSNLKFNKSLNPQISVIISIYNGEPFLKTALRSIQNQDFTNIEIIMVDDHSKDNSVKLARELMKEDPRIILLQNNENKGALYTKTKGVLNSKGKYVLMLDVDDLYISRKAFSILYNEAEKENLDLLGFSIIISHKNIKLKSLIFHHYWRTPVFFQPKVSYMMYKFGIDGKPIRVGDVITCYFIKTKLFVDSIEDIGDYYLNKKIIRHDDFFCFFMMTRKAKNLKQIKNPFYLVLLRERSNNTLIKSHDIEKAETHKKNGCLSYLYYIDFLLKKTDNCFKDKQIASIELENWYLNNNCRNDSFSKQQGILICKLFLENQYIDKNIKNHIKTFFVEINNNTQKKMEFST